MKFTDVRIESNCTKKLQALKDGSGTFHCASCNNTVHDFTNSTEEEFNETMKSMGPEKCGIFYEDQIDPYVYRNSSTPRLIGLTLSFLALLGITSATAQNIPVQLKIEQLAPNKSLKAGRSTNAQLHSEESARTLTDRETKREYKRERKIEKERVKRFRYRRKLLGFIPLPRRKRRGFYAAPRHRVHVNLNLKKEKREVRAKF